MRIKRVLKRIFLIAAISGIGACLIYFSLRPSIRERTEIFKGVFLTVSEVPKSEHGHGKVMIVEVHWDTPGVQIANRPYSFQPESGNQTKPLYLLEPADLGLLRQRASVLVNTTRYHPDEFYRSIPGAPVRSIETLVTNGVVSHVHPHSYMMYWDSLGNAEQLTKKPPPDEILEKSTTALGIQGVMVSKNRAQYQASGNKELVIPRTFIGIDPEKKILWLMAFEHASGFLMIDTAVETGVVSGGQVDSGGGSSLLIGFGAKGIFPHTGIRHWRPLGPYLTIQADPL